MITGTKTELIFMAVMDRIKNDNAIPSTAYDLWFENCKIKEITSDRVCLTVENETKKRSILAHYKDILANYFMAELGYFPNIEIEIDRNFVPKKLIGSDDPDVFDFSRLGDEEYVKERERMKERESSGQWSAGSGQKEENTAKKNFGGAKSDGEGDLEKGRESDDDYNKKEILFRKNNDYTFENYVVGSSNTFAYNAALSISEKPSDEFNPFFIYGPSGIGKTHLLYAIANRILDNYPEKVILYVKGEEFTNALIGSLKEGTMSIFRQKYRNVDVLLVDDIQFIAGKKSSQEEFFHTFNALYENHKQIILTSDKSPSEIEVLESRLSSRFKSGLIADIEPPDFELRLAILRKKAENSGLILSDEILEFLADKLHSNIREIEGVIKKLSALSFLSGIEITMRTVKNNIGDFLIEEEPSKTVVSRVISETAARFEVSIEEILGRKRDKQIQTARNVSMYIIREITSLSLPEIGVMFERKHSSVKSNIDTVKKAMEADVFLERKVEEIIKSVKM